MTRLLMTTDAVGGVWTYALELAAGMAGRGVETTLAVLGPRPSVEQRAAAAATAGVTLLHTDLPLDWTAESPDEVLEAGRTVARLARDVGADLVHLNSPALAASDAFRSPVVGACHSCLATWWAAVKGGEPPADFLWRIDLLARGYRSCDLLIAPTRAFADATRDAHDVRAFTVWNGRTAQPPMDGDRTSVALAAGRLWDEGKGAAVLEAAAAIAKVPIEAAGPTRGPGGEAVELRHVRALGNLAPAALARRLAGARLFVSPALYEPFGLSVLEAAQAGCGLVLSDIPSFRELWNGAAVFVPPGDAQTLACALDSLVADGAACGFLGALARERAEAYRAETMVDATLAAYRSLAAVGAMEAVA